MLDTVTAPLVYISQALSAATEGGEPSFHTAAFERRLSPLASRLSHDCCVCVSHQFFATFPPICQLHSVCSAEKLTFRSVGRTTIPVRR